MMTFKDGSGFREGPRGLSALGEGSGFQDDLRSYRAFLGFRVLGRAEVEGYNQGQLEGTLSLLPLPKYPLNSLLRFLIRVPPLAQITRKVPYKGPSFCPFWRGLRLVPQPEAVDAAPRRPPGSLPATKTSETPRCPKWSPPFYPKKAEV